MASIIRRKKKIYVGLVGLASTLIFFFMNATLPATTCVATGYASWKLCRDRLQQKVVDTIIVNGIVNCPDDSCSLVATGGTRAIITSNTVGVFKRTGGFNKALMTFSQVPTVQVSNLSLQDPANIPIQPTPGAAEVNKYCLSFPGGNCASFMAINYATTAVINNVQFLNGKHFGLSLYGNTSVTLKNSLVSDAFWFGLWGGNNKNMLIANNKFMRNRSNALLMSFANSASTKITGNYFLQNHRATAFHTCNSKPCPGGQIDLTGPVLNVTVEYNIFANGAMSGEFPEDLNYNWVSGIEFEASKIYNTYLNYNIITNNSGSDWYVNLPSNPDFSASLGVTGNTYCNNRTQGVNYGAGFNYASGIHQGSNVIYCRDYSKSTGTIAAPACKILAGHATCSTTVQWSSVNSPNACIFLKGSGALFACGAQASKIAGFINATGVTLELHAERNYFSKLLGAVTVKGVP